MYKTTFTGGGKKKIHDSTSNNTVKDQSVARPNTYVLVNAYFPAGDERKNILETFISKWVYGAAGGTALPESATPCQAYDSRGPSSCPRHVCIILVLITTLRY